MKKLISVEDNEFLTWEVSESELELALKQSSSDKAPGPDGLNSGALKSTWNIIKHKMLETVQSFMANGTLPYGTNSSFICLIPKVKEPVQIKDYTPISLINCSLKMLSKILTNRLSKVIGKIISPNQTGFIKGRQISEGILITNEVIH